MRRFLLAGTIGVLALTACGGGGSTSSGGSTPATTAPTATPAPVTTPASTPQQATVGSSMAFVGSNGHTLYVFSADTANVSNCNTGGCEGVWPPYTAPAGSSAGGTTFALNTRTDGSLQWAYNGQPLYEYSGDTGAAQSNGDGITSFGGTWSVARPNATATTAPGGNSGYTIHRR